MQKIENFESIETVTEFEKLPSGGYVCKITKVEDVADKKYLKVEFDIAEGKFKGEAMSTMEHLGFWTLKFVKSYSEKAQKFFKAFITSVEESNPNFKWDWDEQKLVGKFVGLTIGYEEYLGNDGNIKERTYVDQVRSVDKIRSGNFKMPETKKYQTEEVPQTNSPILADLPF